MDIEALAQRHTTLHPRLSGFGNQPDADQTTISGLPAGEDPSCLRQVRETAVAPCPEPFSPTSTSGFDVDKGIPNPLRISIAALAVAMLAACGTPSAKNFSGPWVPVNRFRNTPTEIPLNPAYTYYASPMDETLKTMLMRWSKDSGRELSYQLPFDVTLYQPVAGIHTTDIDDAVAQLNTIYAAQGISIKASPRRIEAEPLTASTGSNTKHPNVAISPSPPSGQK